ncbi:ketoacyl-ACP synthase III [Limosilactobacillus agrestis]|uniref:beta-ketoacyl-ACP synthase III n=1 Tax=Limosilactobacillus agrestis TaxID=2759748 RepID=UPI001E4B7856|nr:beta-ketoacyl-ACP synthase III [Limosilactobacillus agrestis]MCD7120743.1 ketoacyl-ACP synthase III [Limosilactobacillus agrestis]
MQNLKIISTASYHPPYVVTNQQLSTMMDTSDEWIRTRTGIRQRYISKNENTSDLALHVGKQLLSQANIQASAIDLIIVATMSPDAYTPSTAAILQGKLGADKAVAFDISAACTGFIYALNTAEMMLKSSNWQTAMVIGAEVLSKLLDWNDRSTAVLFGDGAGGVLLQKREETVPLILARDLRTYGKMADKIVAGSTIVGKTFPKQVTSLSPFKMSGREVYRFATHEVPTSIMSAVNKAHLQLNKIDYFLLHQANQRIIEQIAKRLDQPLNKFPVNINEYGNTAAASEPILFSQAIAKGLIHSGNIIALSGFGGGLSAGTIILKY